MGQNSWTGVILIASMLLVGCQAPADPSSAAVQFAVIDSTRATVEANLQLAHARTLRSSEELLRVRLDGRQFTRPMRATLVFKEGQLKSVNYLYANPVRDWVSHTRMGPFGYRAFEEKVATPPLHDYYLYLGPLGWAYFGCDGLAVHPQRVALILSSGVLGLCLAVLAIRRLGKSKHVQ